jgi:hypothetical protein
MVAIAVVLVLTIGAVVGFTRGTMGGVWIFGFCDLFDGGCDDERDTGLDSVSEDGVEIVGVRSSSEFIEGKGSGPANIRGVEDSEGFDVDDVARASVALLVRGRAVLGRRRLFVNSSVFSLLFRLRDDRRMDEFCDGVEGILKTL